MRILYGILSVCFWMFVVAMSANLLYVMIMLFATMNGPFYYV